jgi:hypothetical protein
MDPKSLLASPDAAREFLDARRGLFRAIDFDHNNGVSANMIADLVAPAISRPIVLSYLAAERLRRDARDALRANGLGGSVEAGVTGEIGRGGRVVYLALALDPLEFTTDEADTLLSRVVAALDPAGIELVDPGDGSIRDVFWDGEQIPVRRR